MDFKYCNLTKISRHSLWHNPFGRLNSSSLVSLLVIIAELVVRLTISVNSFMNLNNAIPLFSRAPDDIGMYEFSQRIDKA